MAEELPWIFYGFVTPAQNQVVQEWFDACGEELKDAIRDSLGYHELLERNLWRRPLFDELGDEGISEFRFKVNGIWYRIYGDYGPERHEYTFLNAGSKAVKNDKSGKKVAKERKKQLKRNEGSVHVFRWKEDTD